MMRASSADVPGLVFDLWAAENRALNLYGKKGTRPERYRERLAHGWEASLGCRFCETFRASRSLEGTCWISELI